MLLVVSISALIGKIPNLFFWRDGEPRTLYGFTYPTLEAARIFYFVLAYTAFKKFNLNLMEDIVIAITGCFIIFKTDVRLDGYLTSILLFILIFKKPAFKLLNKLNNFIPVVVIVTLIIGYIFLAKNYNSINPSEFNLNNILSNRLYLTQQGLLRYSIHLFGNHVQM